ncbi:MAG: hypothetical protein LBH11_00640 [Propionibacteriaceae bacterium]|jgi:hypothetical protein|nr:hypothetical protein [Propionibacteriaceae bacterium]
MTQENSPSDTSGMPEPTDAGATVPPPLPDAPNALTNDLSSLQNNPYAVSGPPAVAPAAIVADPGSADAAADPDLDPYTASLLASSLHPAPSSTGVSTAGIPVPKKASTAQRVFAVAIVVAIAVATAILVFKQRGTAPVTTADFKRFASSLADTQEFGEIKVGSGDIVPDLGSCEAYTAFGSSARDYAITSTGLNGTDVLVAIRFMEHDDAVDFALATRTCLEQVEYTDVQVKEDTAGGLFSVVRLYEIADSAEDALMLHIAVYRNVAVWNLDNTPVTPVTMEQWKTWAGEEFMNAVDDARKNK